MWRWLAIVMAGAFLAPFAWASFDRVVGFSAKYQDMGETLAPDKIHSSWGKRLNPSGAIPNKGFKALYFSRDNPGRLVFQENVESIAIKYAWNDFHQIYSQQFGAYWVGKLTFSRTATRQISVSQSWAKSRIFIDGEVVFDGSNSGKTFTHDFSKGEHVIEVEFINNWHTTEFKVTIEDVTEKIEEGQVPDNIGDDGLVLSNLYYVGLYESASKDTAVNVTLPRVGRPVVLWLSSYEAIDWNIVSSDRVTSVFVSSYAPGSRVRGAHVGRVLHVDRSIAIYGENRRCSCTSGSFYCEGESDLENVADKLQSITSMNLTGYAVKYSTADITVVPYKQADRRRILDQREASERAKEACAANANPNFDKLMK